jgi:hypothetical protein
LASLEAECYDSYENGEKDEGVELLQATVKYDPSDADQRQAVERGWEDHISERDYEAVKQTQGAQR